MPGGASGGGMDVGGQIAPAIARMDHDDWTPSSGRPHPAQNRLEADAMLIRRPHLHRRSWMRLRYRPYLGFQVFLKAVRSSGLAALVCRGRGAWGVKASSGR